MSEYGDKDYDSLLREKEHEVQEVRNLRVRGLENKIKEKEKQFELLELQYKELQKDFEYNVEVIKERDEDITELSAHITQLKELIERKYREYEDVHKSSEEQMKADRIENSQLRDKQRSLYEKIDDLKHENKKLKALQSDEVQRNRDEYEKKIKILQDIIKGHEHTIKTSTEEFNQKLKNLSTDSIKANDDFNKIIDNVKRDKLQFAEDVNRKLDIFQAENQKLRDELNKSTHDFMAKDQEQHQKIVDLKIKLQEAQVLKEAAEKELTELKIKSGSWDSNLREKTDFYQLEIEKLSDQLAKTKAKYKNKITFLTGLNEKKVEDVVRESTMRTRRFEDEIKKLTIENERLMMNEKSLKERLQEADHKLTREARFFEDRINQYSRNNEQDMKKLEHDKGLKEFQINQLNEQIRELEKTIEDTRRRDQESAAKMQELEKENNMLIEEVAYYRKDHPIQKGGTRNNVPTINIKQISSPTKIKNQDDLRFRAEDIDTEKSFDQDQMLFSGDLGVPSPVVIGSQNQKFGSKLYNSQNVAVKVLQDRLDEAKREIEDYKALIDRMTHDMENVKYRMETNNHEVNVHKEEAISLKERIMTLQSENLNLKQNINDLKNSKNEAALAIASLNDKKERYTEEIEKLTKELEGVRHLNLKTEQENNTLKQKLANTRVEIDKLKTERDQLIDISNNLRSRMNKMEELGLDQSLTESKVVDDVQESRLLKLQNELNEVKNKLYLAHDTTNNRGTIAGRARKSPEKPYSATKKKENYFQESEAFERGRNNFKNSVNRIKADLHVESSTKPLIDRNSEDLDSNPFGPPPVYRPNSSKATQSQKEVEERLAAKKLRKSPPIARNYNIRDEGAN